MNISDASELVASWTQISTSKQILNTADASACMHTVYTLLLWTFPKLSDPE